MDLEKRITSQIDFDAGRSGIRIPIENRKDKN